MNEVDEKSPDGGLIGYERQGEEKSPGYRWGWMFLGVFGVGSAVVGAIMKAFYGRMGALEFLPVFVLMALFLTALCVGLTMVLSLFEARRPVEVVVQLVLLAGMVVGQFIWISAIFQFGP